jgi:hypothetical protein
MKRNHVLLALAAGSKILASTDAFATQSSTILSSPTFVGTQRLATQSRFSTSSPEDCGCSNLIQYSGDPSDHAQSLDAAYAIQSSPVYNARGEPIRIQLSATKPTIAVFLRSLG